MSFKKRIIFADHLNIARGKYVKADATVANFCSLVFRTTYTTQEAIKNNLIDFFLTEPGERYLNPTFGGGLRSFIFEQISNNTIEGLKEDIQSKLNTNFPNVIVNSLDVLQETDY